MTLATWFFAATCVAVAVAAQVATGVGFGLVAVPLLLVVAPDVGRPAVLLLTVVVMVATTWRERDALQAGDLVIALAAAVPGAGVGVLVLRAVGASALDVVVGALVLAAAVAAFVGVRAPAGPRTLAVAGALSGVMTSVAAMPGPPLAIAYHPSEPRRMRSTLSAYFAVICAFTLILLSLPGGLALGQAWLAASLLPGVAVGLRCGALVVRRLSAPDIRRAALALALLAGAGLVLRGATS